MLRILSCIQREFIDQLFAKVPPASLCEQRIFCMQLHAAHITVFMLACLTDTHVASGNTFNTAVVMIEHFSGGEPGVHLDAEVLCLFCQPTTHVTHGDNEVAFIMHRFWYKKSRHLDCGFFARIEEKCIPCDFSI